ncbi:30S ribosomal protein S17 [Candidatus Wolfebacteria bacterium]|nr:30S ribosomal protein S17 [Candidatus Wolfebacteria bacterium]
MISKIKRQFEGIVTSDKMDKTRVVAVSRLKKHPRYKKYYKVTRKFKAHDEKNEYKIGDKVMIEEIRPMSKDKRWRIVSKVESSQS